MKPTNNPKCYFKSGGLMKIYQIWNETSVGPTFPSLQEALEYLEFKSIGEYVKQTKGNGYPDIQEITIGDDQFRRDR